jgi:DNA-binding transcriptional ArsR family regulator
MKQMTRVFQALADPTRRQILQELKGGELAAGDIAARFPISAPAVSRHLSILDVAGLVEGRREGNRILYSLCADALVANLNDFMSAVCPTQVAYRRRRKA